MFCFYILFLLSSIKYLPSAHASGVGSRIIGGQLARAGQFPWQAAIYLDNGAGRYFCGGALVGPRWVLTAAHCVNRVKEFTIHLGSNSLLSGDDNRVIVSTSTYIVHPDYNENTLEHDVGLIQLRMPVEYTEYVQKISVANQGQIFEGIAVTATGWGQTSDTAAGLNNDLHYVDLVIISNTECQITYGTQIKTGMACAVGNNNEGICIGDTGGPLIKPGVKGEPLHVGVASFMSQNGCETIEPTGYTRTDIYHNWIYNITEGLS